MKKLRAAGVPAPLQATPDVVMRLATMIRTMAIAVSVLACAGGVARAQTPDLDAARTQALQTPLPDAQQRAAEAERDASAASERLQTELTLNTLQRAPMATTPLPADAFGAPPRYNPADQAFAALAAQQAADSDRLLVLQRDALARSNARILAVPTAP